MVALEPSPSRGTSREAIARRDLGHTDVAPALARTLSFAFVALLVIVPTIETGLNMGRDENSPWSHLGLEQIEAIGDTAWRRLVSTNRQVLAAMSAFERALEQRSTIGSALRPPVQALMTRWLRAGNERVYPGRDGWAFYRQDVEYLTRRGFLQPDRLQRRIDRAAEWTSPPEPDPRKAILQLKRDLDQRGITLIVMPTPVKPGVHPERLAAIDATHANVLQNPSYESFVADLERGGVLVFDAAGALADARSDEPQYLATDTHWRPETMEAIAASLGDFVTTHGGLSEAVDPDYRIERIERRNIGDTARMLDLPEDSTLFDPETVWLRRVLYQDGSLWRSSRDADVLLMGDSFSNMYSLESMGWGTSAGLAEQLSFVLRRPVDRLVQNDQGSFATRAMLQDDPERLKGKRVVVYQFAVRELTDGDWKVLPLPVPES